MKIAFIGLGNMGVPMALNLVAAGFEVIGYDPIADAPEGIEMASSAQDAAFDADAVITMLPNGEILRAVAAQIRSVTTRGALHLDCSTVDVESARAVAELAKVTGMLTVDAPVSGGVRGATDGTLTFMAGGSDAAFARAAPFFDAMGRTAIHCGPSGAGQAAKICNNMILGVTMLATCEAFVLADSLGLDRQKLFDVVSTSSGANWSMNTYCPAPGVGPASPADNDYQPGFAAELMLKDLLLSQQAAETGNISTPLGARAAVLYQQFIADGGQGKDFSAVLPYLMRRGRSGNPVESQALRT